MKEAQDLHKNLVAIRDEVNIKTKTLSSDKWAFFDPITLTVKFDHSELCFNTTISWMYALIIESAGRNLDFVKKKFTPLGVSINEDALNLDRLIHAFRTVLQHNLDLNKKEDIEKFNICESWFDTNIGLKEPKTDKDWDTCIITIYSNGIDLLGGILRCLNIIENSEHLDVILYEWDRLITRSYSVFDFEGVLNGVLENLGFAGCFDENRVVKSNISKWRLEMDVLPDNFDFSTEAYKIIERHYLNQGMIPIDGNDIIGLGVPKGRQIGTYLEDAKVIFKQEPCNKEKLLEKLMAIINPPS